MILMQGSTRILEKPLDEQSGSSSQLKLLSIYGITSYSQLYNIPLTIKNTTGSDTYININVNGLGVKPLKYNGISTLPSNILVSDSIYTIMYNGTDFILQLLSIESNDSFSLVAIPETILSLTNQSTSNEITNAFGGQANMEIFMESFEEPNIVYISGVNSSSYLTVLKVFATISSGAEIDTIQVIVPSSKKLVTLEFNRIPYDSTYTSVVVTEEDLGGHDYSTEIANLTSRVEALEQQLAPTEVQDHYEIEYD